MFFAKGFQGDDENLEKCYLQYVCINRKASRASYWAASLVFGYGSQNMETRVALIGSISSRNPSILEKVWFGSDSR